MKEAVFIEDVALAGIESVAISCEPCKRRGVYSVRRLCQERPGLRMTDFLADVTGLCDRRHGAGVYARCLAVYEPGSLPDL